MSSRLFWIGLLVFVFGENSWAQQNPPGGDVRVTRWQCRFQRQFHGSDVLGIT